MYGPTDLKKNVLITLDGQPYKVVEYAQKVMGRGGSIVNVKVKNLITGALQSFHITIIKVKIWVILDSSHSFLSLL